MSKRNRFLTAAVLALFFVGMAAADTLELKDGRVLRGKYLGGTQAVLRFEVNGEVQAFNTVDIVALTFTGRSVGGPPAVAPSAMAPTTPPPMAAAPAAGYGDSVTVPAGQSLLVRMIDGVDSSKNHVELRAAARVDAHCDRREGLPRRQQRLQFEG